MIYSIKFYPKAEKTLCRLSDKDKIRIFKSLSGLKTNHFAGKKLKGVFAGYYSLRVWPYRMIYFVQKNKCLILVINVGHGKNIYK